MRHRVPPPRAVLKPAPIRRVSPTSQAFPRFETIEIGGLPVARLNRAATAQLTIDLALRFRRGDRPWLTTSINGQVISNASRDKSLREALLYADVISCDGQPLVMASRQITGFALPERVATTDLLHDIANAAHDRPLTMFFLGASEAENARAVANVRQAYPHLRIVGRLHGYHSHAEWVKRVVEIDALAPDLLWVGLGVPREQEFYMRFAHAMPNVGLIKTCGGMLNFLSASAARAPRWMQDSGFEWAFRLKQEPRRLLMRYLTTNPHAALLMVANRKLGKRVVSLGKDQDV